MSAVISAAEQLWCRSQLAFLQLCIGGFVPIRQEPHGGAYLLLCANGEPRLARVTV